MCHFGHSSPKRTILWSTGSIIGALKAFETMVRKDFTFDPKKKTAETYINGRGEKAYKGSKCLKGTQPPGWKTQSTFFYVRYGNLTCSFDCT